MPRPDPAAPSRAGRDDATLFGDDVHGLLWFNGAAHLVLLVLGGLVLDGGVAFGHFRNVTAIYWAVAAIVLLGSRAKRSRWDMAFLKYGTAVALAAEILLHPVSIMLRDWLFEEA